MLIWMQVPLSIIAPVTRDFIDLSSNVEGTADPSSFAEQNCQKEQSTTFHSIFSIQAFLETGSVYSI